jgi:hypothetical protein
MAGRPGRGRDKIYPAAEEPLTTLAATAGPDPLGVEMNRQRLVGRDQLFRSIVWLATTIGMLGSAP